MTPSIKDYDSGSLDFCAKVEEFENIRHPEDGTQLLGEAYSVVATAPDGTRFIHLVGMWDWIVGSDEDGDLIVYRSHDRKDMAGRAQRLADTLNENKHPVLVEIDWDFAGAVYGSEAYQKLNLEAETAAWERNHDRW